jgi:hypothetical protein
MRREMRADRAASRAELAEWRAESRADRRRSDERWAQLLGEVRAEAAQRHIETRQMFRETRQAFREIRSVGLSIVKTLNVHTRLLRSIDGKLGGPRQNGPRP